MRREIGSEFWDVPVADQETKLFPESTQWYLSGRSALQAIIQNLSGVKTAALPSWCCDSMIKPFIDAGIEVQFYPVYVQNGLQQEILKDCDALLLMDYFGYTSQPADLTQYRGIVIRDVTHSVFSRPYSDASYYFGSLRKWCGMWTGGYAWTENKIPLSVNWSTDIGYTKLRERAMALKNCYINKCPDEHGRMVLDKSYLSVFEEAEEYLETAGIIPAEHRDIALAKLLDADGVRQKRRANAKLLMEAFSEQIIFTALSDTDCPMFVPIIVPQGKRDALRRHLITNEIYCPVHWPVSPYHKLDVREQYLYENELSLVCDQRYTEEDMRRIVAVIESFWKEL